MDNLAPIILFVYNRLEHTKKVVEALQQNTLAPKSKLFIFSDAAKNIQNDEKVSDVRKYVRDITGFKELTITEREVNYGLSKSIITGVTEIVNKYGRVIVLEDDIVTSKFFLEYMNEALDRYKDEKDVYSITGYSFLKNIKEVELPESYFLTLTSAWSWATWKEKWACFDGEAKGWEELKTNKKLRKDFDYGNSVGMYIQMLAQMEKKSIDSWAIRWYWSVFKQNGLILYPLNSLIVNIGYDGTGVHCGYNANANKIELSDIRINEYETQIKENVLIKELVKKGFSKQKFMLIRKITNKINMVINNA